MKAEQLLPSRRAFATQTFLAVLVAAFLVPVIIFASLLLGRFAQGERLRQHGDALDIARQMATELDRELSGLQSAAQVLTTYRSIDARDYPTLYAQATEVRRFLGVDIILKDASGQQLVNTRLPWGTPLPVSLPEADKRALETKRPVISDLFTGATAQRPIVSINVPVLRNGEAIALVNMALDTDRLGQVLRMRGLPDQWVSAIVDRNGRIIARSRQHDQFVGQTATADLRENATGSEGTWVGTTVDGIPALSAYARSPLSDWRVAVGAPVTAVEAPLRRTLLWLIGLGGTALALSALIAGWCGRQIARSLRSLAQAASSLSGANAIQPPHTRLQEVNAIGDALVAASLDLRQKTEARDQAEGELRAETERLEILNRTGEAIASELDLQKLVQKVTDAGVALTGARFGAFFYNVTDTAGETLTLYTISGVPREEFSKFPMPRSTHVFAPTFTGAGVVRSDDITQDPRYGHNAPHKGMPGGHLPVRSYLAVPVTSRSGGVIGGLFFGHPEPGVFTERHESLTVGIAGQAAVALDNAGLYQAAQAAQEALRDFNQKLEVQVAERTRELQEAHNRVLAEVTQRERIEDQLRQAQKMEAVGQLTGGIAHDFNNLLAVITGNLQLMQRRLDKGQLAALPRYLENAADGAQRAATLTHRLLAFSRQQALAPESVDTNKLVAGMSDLLRRTIGEHIAVESVLAGGLWRTHADPNQLEHAILNLAVNARDAMPDGGKLTIETANCHLDERYVQDNAGATSGQFVMLAVTDTGAGMAPDVLGKAFEPFYTTKPVGQGTGLGLSQVYGFVRQSGGHVKIYSELGQGTTVKIYLPRFFGEPQAVASESGIRALPVSTRRETVLVVEDDDAVRRMSTEAMSELGYRVLEAENAASALRILDADPGVRLLFTDVVMPEVNGRKLADEALRRRPELKVLFTTGYTRNAVVHNGVLDAGVHLIGKPYTLEELARMVREVLDSES